MHHTDDSDGATAHAATYAAAVPPPYLHRADLHRYDQAAHHQAAGPRWRHHDRRSHLTANDGEPLDRTPAAAHRTDTTIRNAITALNWPRPNARGALALGHGWRTCATCTPRNGPQHLKHGASSLQLERSRSGWSDREKKVT